MDRARLFLKRGLLALGLLIVPTLLLAQGPYSAQIQQALQAFVQQAHTWTATQTFDDVTVTGTCTGCGGGGTGNVSAAGTLTQYAVVLGDGSADVAVVSGLGSVGNVLTSNGAGAAPTFQTPSGGGGLVLLEQHTASSSASLDFTTCITSTYDEYIFEVVNLVPATNTTDLWMRFSTNGGSSYDSSSVYWWSRWYTQNANSSGILSSNSTDAKFIIADFISSSLEGASASIKVFNPLSTTNRRQVLWHALAAQPTVLASQPSGGVYTSTGTGVDAVQFLYSSGNIASGTIRCYGLAKSDGGWLIVLLFVRRKKAVNTTRPMDVEQIAA